MPAALLACLTCVLAAEAPNGPGRQPVQGTTHLHQPPPALDVLLGRPTGTGITVSVRAAQAGPVAIAWAPAMAGPGGSTTITVTSGDPQHVPLTGLVPDTAYRYTARTAGTVVEGRFHTARPPGAHFVATIIADSHLDQNTDPTLYRRTLATAAAQSPDFHLDLGDTFMTEKHATRADALLQYQAQRTFWSDLGRQAPLFLVIGNHDGENVRRPDDEDLAVWSCTTRKRFVPNPEADGFYGTDGAQNPRTGPLQDAYAWTWGDAQFIVLDPFWHGLRGKGLTGAWKRSLGETQYRWLAATLEGAAPRWRFVFIHHLVGGSGGQSRGGAEAAALYEWGGQDEDGQDAFARCRPGWTEPIHALLRRHHVTAVFHGHDHLFAAQERDGIRYIAVPQPGHAGSDAPPTSALTYGYASGRILGCPGVVRLEVGPTAVTWDLLRPDGTQAFHDGITATP